MDVKYQERALWACVRTALPSFQAAEEHARKVLHEQGVSAEQIKRELQRPAREEVWWPAHSNESASTD